MVQLINGTDGKTNDDPPTRNLLRPRKHCCDETTASQPVSGPIPPEQTSPPPRLDDTINQTPASRASRSDVISNRCDIINRTVRSTEK